MLKHQSKERPQTQFKKQNKIFLTTGWKVLGEWKPVYLVDEEPGGEEEPNAQQQQAQVGEDSCNNNNVMLTKI